jgi:hypothetical protein
VLDLPRKQQAVEAGFVNLGDLFVNNAAFPFAMRQMRQSFQHPRLLAGLAGLALILGLSGPFDTLNHYSLPLRLAYWALLVPLTFAAGRFGSALAAHPLARLPRALRILGRGLVSGLAVCTALQLVCLGLGQGSVGPETLLAVLTICLVIETLGDLMQTANPQPDPPAILSRLPLEKRGALVALCVQDHYVEVITTKGRAMILMRLSDAIRETAPQRGLQIHRSTWVALDQVAEVSLKTAEVLTHSGERLAVARQRLGDLAKAGLLPRRGA